MCEKKKINKIKDKQQKKQRKKQQKKNRKQKKTTRKEKKQKKAQRQRQKLGHSRFNLFFKVIESRKSFGGVRERVSEAGGRRDK